MKTEKNAASDDKKLFDSEQFTGSWLQHKRITIISRGIESFLDSSCT